jgi:hypothetical protein
LELERYAQVSLQPDSLAYRTAHLIPCGADTVVVMAVISCRSPTKSFEVGKSDHVIARFAGTRRKFSGDDNVNWRSYYHMIE